MAAYRRVDDLVTCGLTACTPGSAVGPTLSKEHRKPLHLPFMLLERLNSKSKWQVYCDARVKLLQSWRTWQGELWI